MSSIYQVVDSSHILKVTCKTPALSQTADSFLALSFTFPLQLRAGKKLSLNNDYTSASHGSPKRKICHFTSTFTVAILTKCPYATSSEHWIYAYLHQVCEQQ